MGDSNLEGFLQQHGLGDQAEAITAASGAEKVGDLLLLDPAEMDAVCREAKLKPVQSAKLRGGLERVQPLTLKIQCKLFKDGEEHSCVFSVTENKQGTKLTRGSPWKAADEAIREKATQEYANAFRDGSD